jgi:hypothetical protein
MIGVWASGTDLEIVNEFFELFKTPWEPVKPGRRYPVVLSTHEDLPDVDTDVLLLYGPRERSLDRDIGVAVGEAPAPANVEWEGERLPLYGAHATFGTTAPGWITSDHKPVTYRHQTRSRTVWRIGYDLFGETRYLLTQGQPAANALAPTLDLHIAFLRHILLQSGVAFVEIPPRPDGYEFIGCLTHDVDFVGIRRQGLDRTMAGFLARASIGSLLDVVRGRRTLAEAWRNGLAVLSLPMVFMRLLPDFWRPFAAYAEIENIEHSTFFVVPFEGRPGRTPEGGTCPTRAVRYGIADVADDVRQLATRGTEIAVHGLDAWREASAGRSELAACLSVTVRRTAGVRMHWLFFDTDSARELELAGFDYDATWGYNEAVGYRAGTSQVFRLPGTRALLELPLSIMDTALLSRGRMGLPPETALALCRRIVTQASRFGGTLVINWHCRSLAPERLWGRPYQRLLAEVNRNGRAWQARAGEAVEWFRWRRSIRYSQRPGDPVVDVHAPGPRSSGPGAVVRVHRPRPSGVDVSDLPFDGGSALRINLSPRQMTAPLPA